MDIGCELWGLELSSLDVTPEDTGQFFFVCFFFKHVVLEQILFWRNPLTRLKSLIIYVDADLSVCFFRLCE